ncbi:MAG: DNA polymerase III subunit epsilon, partial [Caulobacteraceae bacterium]
LALRSTPEEQAAHVAFLAKALKDRSLWEAYGLPAQDDAA